jgi:hypothetical protein
MLVEVVAGMSGRGYIETKTHQVAYTSSSIEIGDGSFSSSVYITYFVFAKQLELQRASKSQLSAIQRQCAHR